MNENLDLVDKLKDCPEGTMLWSPLCGEVVFERIVLDDNYPIRVFAKTDFDQREVSFTSRGTFYSNCRDGECVLFPSKDQQDWDKFVAHIEKFDYSTLKPFDRVLVRFSDDHWRCGWFSYMNENMMYCDIGWRQGIPYNDEPKHLLGTTDMPDEKYIWWEK